MDSNYLSRVTARRNLITQHTSSVLGTIPSGEAPVRELYTYLLGTYLPTRYPTMFELQTQNNTLIFRNKITTLDSPVHPPPADPIEMLRILGETVEDDIFLLLRDDDKENNNGEHRAVAFVCCHPAGFDPSQKLGKRLVEIHGPVPAYEKIGASMERYFGRLEVGRPVKRMNVSLLSQILEARMLRFCLIVGADMRLAQWSVQTHSRLYAPSGNHVHVGEEVEEEASIDIDQARLRVELQTLTRLPETQAILFSFETYMYPLAEIKAEGLGPQLADAIQGLKAGNAPGMWMYKGGVRWGKAACQYLRA
jgi:hypothetical protein